MTTTPTPSPDFIILSGAEPERTALLILLGERDALRKQVTDLQRSLDEAVAKSIAMFHRLVAMDASFGILDLTPMATALLSELGALRGRQAWQPIETAPRTDHMRTILVYWRSVGHACESYYDVDEQFDRRPRGWVSPEEGWRSPGDQCIPRNQEDATHWMPLPAPPIRTADHMGNG